MIGEYEIIVRLLLAVLISGLIGFERELKNHPAGLRTHILVTVGSALVMLISKYGFDDLSRGYVGDPGRLAAQVISGIGFLGAGTIIMQGNVVRGLTTAASLWTSACIGLAIGAGYYMGGITAAVLVLFTLLILGILEKKFYKNRIRKIHIEARDNLSLMEKIGTVFSENEIAINGMNVKRTEEDGNRMVHMIFSVRLPNAAESNKIVQQLSDNKDINRIYWEEIQ